MLFFQQSDIQHRTNHPLSVCIGCAVAILPHAALGDGLATYIV